MGTKSSSGSELKKVQTVVVLGKKSDSHLATVAVSPIIAGEAFAIHYEGKIELPMLTTRWNVQKMVEEPLKGGFQGELRFGKPSQMKSIKVVAKLETTEELKREILESLEFKQCISEQRKQELLTPICTIVREQAASLDKIHLTIQTPTTWSESSLMNLLDGVSKAITAKVWTPTREYVLRNIRFMGFVRFFLPTTALRNPMEVAALKLSGDQIPSTCRVEPTFIRTFDNMTVEYPINNCEHVLLLDGSEHIPIA